jgi:hypothetical protein
MNILHTSTLKLIATAISSIVRRSSQTCPNHNYHRQFKMQKKKNETLENILNVVVYSNYQKYSVRGGVSFNVGPARN